MTIGTFIKLTSAVLVFTTTHLGSATTCKNVARRNSPVDCNTAKSPKLDKTWTKGVAEKKNDLQVPVVKALTSRVSLQAERTGLSGG